MASIEIKIIGYDLRFPEIKKDAEGKKTDATIKALENFESTLKGYVTDNPNKVVMRECQPRDLLGRIASALSKQNISVKKDDSYNADKWGETEVVFLGDSADSRTRASENNAKKRDMKDTYQKVSVLTAESLKKHDLIFSLGNTIYIAGGTSLIESKQAAMDLLREKMEFKWV